MEEAEARAEAMDGLQSSERNQSFCEEQTPGPSCSRDFTADFVQIPGDGNETPGPSCLPDFTEDFMQIPGDGNETSRDIDFGEIIEEIGNNETDTSEDNEITLLPDDAVKNFLFFFKGTFVRRLFRGQMRPRAIGTMNVGGNTIQEVITFIWKLAKKHVLRQIVFDGDAPTWAEKQLPDEADVEQFILLHDQAKKKTYNISAITPRVLASWKDKPIKIFVHAYSTNVETHAQHQMVLKQLLAPNNADRSGANSTRDGAALAKELKESHLDLEGHHSSWLLWANFIHSSPAHKQEQLKVDPTPPLELAKYFRWTNVSESARLQSVHRGVTVAHTINDGWVKDVVEIFQGLSSAVSILTNVSQKLETLISKGTAAGEFIAAVQSAVRPEESELSKVLAENVTDCPDIDHS